MTWSLVYLHGVGQSVYDDRWYHALHEALAERGVDLPPLGSERVIAPTYVELLKTALPDRIDEPLRTRRFSGSEAERLELRAAHSRRQAAFVRRHPDHDVRGFHGVASGLDPSTSTVLKMANHDFEDARRYLNDPALRHAILHRVLDRLGTARDLVVVAHSLGSIVAIDLLAHLPPGVRIRRLVTLGSPAGAPGFHKQGPERLLEARQFPYHQVESWVNVLSPWDPVTYGRGISGHFPAAVDVRVRLPFFEHVSAAYLSAPVVGDAIADVLLPPEVAAPPGAEVAVPLRRDEHLVLDQLVFGTLVRDRLEEKNARRSRFDGALRHVAHEVGQRLAEERVSAGLPASVELLAATEGRVDELHLSDRPLDDQLLVAIVAGTNNPVAPFDIGLGKETVAAVRDLWLAYGHSPADAGKVAQALQEAFKAFDGPSPWKWLALGAAGLALIAVPPLGVALGGAGLAGGAAVTAGLAAFGPGGMVGGMALASGLIGLGSASVTASIRLPGNLSPDELQTQVVRYLAFARASDLLDLPGDASQAWFTLSEWYDTISREVTTLALYSDDGSPGLKAMRTRQGILRQALGWLADRNLTPHFAPHSQGIRPQGA